MDVEFDYPEGGRDVLSLSDREIWRNTCFDCKICKETKLGQITVCSDRVVNVYGIVPKNYAGTNINEDFDKLGDKMP